MNTWALMDFAPLTPEIQMEGLIDLQRNSHWVVKSPLDSLGHVKSEILDNAFILKCHQLAHALQNWLTHTLFITSACPTEGRSWSNSSTGPARQWTDSKRLCSHHEAKRCHFRVYSFLVKGALAFKMVSGDQNLVVGPPQEPNPQFPRSLLVMQNMQTHYRHALTECCCLYFCCVIYC